MKLERIYNPTDNRYYYINELGKTMPDQIEVFVDGRRLIADFTALSVEEGWVDMEMPVLEKVCTFSKDEKPELLEDGIMTAPCYKVEKTRIQGKIEVLLPADETVSE